jgi:hypothetical protein
MLSNYDENLIMDIFIIFFSGNLNTLGRVASAIIKSDRIGE